jgi:DNA-binding transcriptional MerR regulator
MWSEMPDEGIRKLYYSIGEVSEITGLEQHVLRYWETEFEMLRPRKNRAGRRVYTAEDINTVLRLRHLLRDEKYTIEGARQVLEREGRPAPEEDFREALADLRDFLKDVLSRL